MHKKALSDVVTTVLVILIAMAGVIIIWNFMQPFLANSGIDTQKLTASLDIPSNSISLDSNENLLSLNIERNPGEGDIAGFIFGLQDPSGLVKTFRQNLTLYEYETKNFTVNYSEFPLEDVVSITVTPIFRNNKTQEEIYGIPITQPVKNKTFKIPSSLIAYWKFDEAAGATTFKDSKGQYNLIKIGAGVINSGQAGKKNSKSAYFSGTSATTYLNASSSSNLEQNSFTTYIWFKPTSQYKGIILSKSKRDSNNKDIGFSITYSSTASVFNVTTFSSSLAINTFLVPLDSWTQISVVYDKNLRKMSTYVNGLKIEELNEVDFSNADNSIQLGKLFNGYIDEVMIFDDALTETQIQGLYNLYK